jgi:anti-sigma B factor antagonist
MSVPIRGKIIEGQGYSVMAVLTYQAMKKNGLLLINVGGSLDFQEASKFDAKLDADIATGGRYIILNMSMVDYIASAGLGVLISKNSILRKKGGEIILSSMPDKVKEIFELVSFEKVFKIYKNDEDAIRSFSQR